MNYFTIKDLENFSGIKAHTIRTWEQRFDFLKPQRSVKLRRNYTTEELKLILDIALLNRYGYKISHIAKLNKEDIASALSGLAELKPKQERAINQLIMSMATMDTDGFEMVFASCLLAWDVEDTIQYIIVPFLYKTGLFQTPTSKWQKPQLLLIEQSIKQKLILGIEKVSPVKNGKSALFFLSKKTSELSLLYVEYFLKANGFSTWFVGCLPSAETVEIITLGKKPDFIITDMAEKSPQPATKMLFKFVEKQLPKSKVFYLGNGNYNEPKNGDEKIERAEAVDELLNRLLLSQKEITLPELN